MIYLLIMGLTSHSYEPTLNGEGRELLVRKDVHSDRAWNSSGAVTYANSTIDRWQNNVYKKLFSASVQAMMGTTAFYYTPAGDDYTVTTLSRSVFLLSGTELGYAQNGLNVEGASLPITTLLRPAQYHGENWIWWTRSPTTSPQQLEVWNLGRFYEGVVQLDNYAPTYDFGARPCFTLPSTAIVTEELELVEG